MSDVRQVQCIHVVLFQRLLPNLKAYGYTHKLDNAQIKYFLHLMSHSINVSDVSTSLDPRYAGQGSFEVHNGQSQHETFAADGEFFRSNNYLQLVGSSRWGPAWFRKYLLWVLFKKSDSCSWSLNRPLQETIMVRRGTAIVEDYVEIILIVDY